MSLAISNALAVSFVTGAETFTFKLSSTTTYTASLAAGTYRINLAPSASDALRVLAAAMNAAAPALPGGVSFACTISTTTGLVTITCTGDTFTLVSLHSTALGLAIGYTAAAGSYTATHAGGRMPWYLVYFASLSAPVPQPRRSQATERDASGRVYTFAGSLTHHDLELTAEFIPRDQTQATALGGLLTPYYPEAQYLASLADTNTARPWSIADNIVAAQNVQCALTLADLGTWLPIVTSTTLPYYVGRIGEKTLGGGAPEQQFPSWLAWLRWRFTFALPSSGMTGTRA